MSESSVVVLRIQYLITMFCNRYKHAVEKAQKMENVMEKYKKKLEESAELRRMVKVCIGFHSLPSFG